MRALIASCVALAAAFVMIALVFAQYTIGASASAAEHKSLSPLVDTSNALTIAEAKASGSLADYIMLNRPKPLDQYRQSIGLATTLLDEIEAGIPLDNAEPHREGAGRPADVGQVRRRPRHRLDGCKQACQGYEGDQHE